MSLPDPVLLRAVAQAMVDVAPDGWHRMTLDVMAAYDHVDTGIEVEMADGSISDEDVLLELEGLDAVDDLRKGMYEPGKGTWYLATITVTAGEHADAPFEVDHSFDFDHAPYGGIKDGPDGGNADPALLLRDHQVYPRSPENLPSWHPARESAVE